MTTGKSATDKGCDEILKNYGAIGIRAVAAACSVSPPRANQNQSATARRSDAYERDARQPESGPDKLSADTQHASEE